MSKLNIKVVDMENSVTELAKKVTLTFSHLYSQSTRLSRTTAKSDSLQTRSRKTLTRCRVSERELLTV